MLCTLLIMAAVKYEDMITLKHKRVYRIICYVHIYMYMMYGRYTCTCMCMYLCMYTCRYVYMYVHVYMQNC